MKNFKLDTSALVSLLLLIILPAYTHAAESRTFQGESGFSTSFSLIGGQYSLYVNAHFAANYRTHSPNSCVFSGNLKRDWPNPDSQQFGGAAPITNPVHFTLGPLPVSLQAGQYSLYVASATDCHWTFSLESTPQNPAGLAEVQVFRANDNVLKASDTVSLKDGVQFSAQLRTNQNKPEQVSGELQLIHDGRVVQTLPLTVVSDGSKDNTLAIKLSWEAGDSRYLGKNTAKFVVKIGSGQFSKSKDFTLTP